MDFLKNILSSCLGALLAMIAVTILSFIFISVLVAGLSEDKAVTIKDNSVLHLKLDAEFVERVPDDPLAELPVFGTGAKRIGLLQLKEAINHAKDDPKIEGIYLDVSQPMAFYPTLEEIRTTLLDFKESGKWVLAYTEAMSEGAYYLSTAADEIYLNPNGDLEFNGLTAQFVSFKKLLDKLEINPQVFRVGEFKSAVEPFLRENMSDENRLQLQALVNSIYDHMLQVISEARKIDKAKLKDLSDNMSIRNAQNAVDAGLVDRLFYEDEFRAELRERLGLGEDEKIGLVEYLKYRKSYQASGSSKNEIAVIVAEGTIMPGGQEQSEAVIGADAFVEEIAKARKDDDVKAIVLRVNSPGGEFRSSDMIWREVKLASQVKPVIASMGDYAASGGYYISMACDTIVAQPNTVTGSIGIFGIMFDLSDFFDEKLGVTFDEVRTGKYGEMYTVTRPLTEAEKDFWQRALNDHYDTFITKAAEGRDVAKDDILAVAGGRVWTGVQAQERKLVDVLGGFDDAVRIAAEKAGIADDYKLRFYPKQKTFLEQLLEGFEENAKADALKAELGEKYKLYERWKNVQHYQGAQARMPFELVIE